MKAEAHRPNDLMALSPKRRVRTLVLIGAIALLASCSSQLAQLPELAKLPEKVLNKDEQQTKINEMTAKGQAHQTEAAKAIENEK
jgi:outer membrane biogenesis lipoprotein LolB